MNKIQKIALTYVLTLAVFGFGYSVARFQLPPFHFLESRVQEIRDFAAGDVLEQKTSVLQKLESDAGLAPHRFLYTNRAGKDDRHVPLAVPGLKSDRARPQVYIDDQHADGYRIIMGAMNFEKSFWGALLIGPDGKTKHTWHLSTNHVPGALKNDLLKNLYGTHIGRDGSIIFNQQQAGGGIVKVDVCSNILWTTPGLFHHAATGDGDGAFWTFTGVEVTLDQNMARLSKETGEILQTIDMAEVRERNRNLNIWNLIHPRLQKTDQAMTSGNMSHGNAIQPLTKEFAPFFEDFNVGDLLISYGTTNLIFVLDPQTLEVKWWRIGIGDFQHDPDWEADGRIAIYSNEQRKDDFSKIVAIDPRTYKHEIIFDGEKNEFKSRINGKHQRTQYATRMITSATQGWAFEINDEGETVFSFINSYDKDRNTALHLSNALHYPAEFFEGKPWEACDVHG